MQLTRYQLLLSVLFVYLLPITVTKSIWCVPHGDYINECNRCWCVNRAIFLCGHVNCKKVPLKFWRSMKPKPTEEGVKAIEKFYEKEKGEDPLKVHILPLISKYLEERIEKWDEKKLQKLHKWLDPVVFVVGYGVISISQLMLIFKAALDNYAAQLDKKIA